jgi:hypothetical protein
MEAMMLKRSVRRGILTLSCLLAAACAARGVPSHIPPDPLGDPPLYGLLAAMPLEGAAADSLAAYEAAHPRDFLERIAAVAEDPGASAAIRHNAVLLLGERGAVAQLPSLQAAQQSPDLRVRGAVVTAAQRMIEGGRPQARPLVVAALADSAPEVRAKALEVLGAGDLPLLRDFLGRERDPAVTEIARGLVQAAEERGYPLAPDSAGVLRRTAAAGHQLEFVPVLRWRQWDAALGTVTITPRDGTPFRIDSVEVVRSVVPVAFSVDGRYVAYERARTMFVRDLQNGSTRSLGPGIAPRLRPFSDEFVFLRERSGRHELAQNTRISYDVLHVGFAPGGAEPRALGALGVLVQPDRHGSYSPARWMHVSERELLFRLEGEGVETFPLPDPFSGRTDT